MRFTRLERFSLFVITVTKHKENIPLSQEEIDEIRMISKILLFKFSNSGNNDGILNRKYSFLELPLIYYFNVFIFKNSVIEKFLTDFGIYL